MMAARSRPSSPLAHRWTATRSTVMPASAAKVAWGSLTPRWRRAAADRCRVVGQLGEFALAQFGVGGDHGLALAGQVPAKLAEHVGGGVEAPGHRVEGAFGCWRAGHAGHDPLLQEGRSTEEHLSLVGEVPEERALGQPCSSGDLGGCGLVESPL